MKKSLLTKTSLFSLIIIFLLLSCYGNVYSQRVKVELTPFGGYLLGGSIKFYEGKFKIEDNACYGGMIAFQVHSSNFVELSYTRMDTKGDWHPNSFYSIDFPDKSVNLSVNYLQIGSVSEFPLQNEKLRPYGTVTLGTTWFHPEESSASDEWLFSFAAGLGLKYFFNETVGIRLQARILLPVVYNGSGFYLGVGTGGASSGVYVSSTTPVIEGDFTGGIIIALGR